MIDARRFSTSTGSGVANHPLAAFVFEDDVPELRVEELSCLRSLTKLAGYFVERGYVNCDACEPPN